MGAKDFIELISPHAAFHEYEEGWDEQNSYSRTCREKLTRRTFGKCYLEIALDLDLHWENMPRNPKSLESSSKACACRYESNVCDQVYLENMGG